MSRLTSVVLPAPVGPTMATVSPCLTSRFISAIRGSMACAERVFGVLDEPEEQPDADDAIVIAEPRGAITFDHVAFSYRPTEPLIADMNLNVKQGDTVAIV